MTGDRIAEPKQPLREVPPGHNILLQQTIPEMVGGASRSLISFHFPGQEQNPLVENYRTTMERVITQELAAHAQTLMASGVGRKPEEIIQSLKGFEEGMQTGIKISRITTVGDRQTIINGASHLDEDGRLFYLEGLTAASMGPQATDVLRLLTAHNISATQQVPLASLCGDLGIGNAEARIHGFAKILAQTAEQFAAEGAEQGNLIGWTSKGLLDGKGPLQQSLQLI